VRRAATLLLTALSLLLTGLLAYADAAQDAPALIITRDFSSRYAAYGDQITLSYTVRNVSRQPASGIVISDSLLGEVGHVDLLAAGASRTVVARVRVTADCVSAPQVRYTLDGGEHTASAAAGTVSLENVALSAVLAFEAGGEQAVTLTVSNQGSAPLYDVKAVDDTLGDMGPAVERLDPGESAAFSRAARPGRFQCTVTAVSSAGKDVLLRSNELLSQAQAAPPDEPRSAVLTIALDGDGQVVATLYNPGQATLRDVTLCDAARGVERPVSFVPAGSPTHVLWAARPDDGDDLSLQAVLRDGTVLAEASISLPSAMPADGPAEETGFEAPDGASLRMNEAQRTYRRMIGLTVLALAAILVVWRLTDRRRRRLERRKRLRQRQESRRKQQGKKNGEKTA